MVIGMLILQDGSSLTRVTGTMMHKTQGYMHTKMEEVNEPGSGAQAERDHVVQRRCSQAATSHWWR